MERSRRLTLATIKIGLAAVLILPTHPAFAEDAKLCRQGEAAAKAGKHALAVKAISQCIKHGKLKTEKLRRAYYERGKSLFKLNRLGPAATDLNQTIGMRYKLEETYAQRALIFARAGKHGRAIVDFDRAIRAKPEDAGNHYNRALSHMASANYQKALKDFDKVAKLNPSYIGAVEYNRGIVYAKMKIFDKAASSFDRSINRRWRLAIGYYRRGLSFLKAKKHDLAIQHFNYAIVLRPNFGDAYTYRGLAREGKNQKAQAISDYRSALQYDTAVPWTAKRIKQLRL